MKKIQQLDDDGHVEKGRWLINVDRNRKFVDRKSKKSTNEKETK